MTRRGLIATGGTVLIFATLVILNKPVEIRSDRETIICGSVVPVAVRGTPVGDEPHSPPPAYSDDCQAIARRDVLSASTIGVAGLVLVGVARRRPRDPKPVADDARIHGS